MFGNKAPDEYLADAEMHEQLAAATDDVPARKMHLAMAAEYRRKAAEMGAIVVSPTDTGPVLKLNAAAL